MHLQRYGISSIYARYSQTRRTRVFLLRLKLLLVCTVYKKNLPTVLTEQSICTVHSVHLQYTVYSKGIQYTNSSSSNLICWMSQHFFISVHYILISCWDKSIQSPNCYVSTWIYPKHREGFFFFILI